MKILIRSILVILALIALLGVLSITPFGQGIIGGDAARQACIDHMADQAAKGQPIPYRDRLEQWAKLENRNLFAEPEIFNYFTKYETSGVKEREAMRELAADRLRRGMEDCDTVSVVPIGIEQMKTQDVYFEYANSAVELWEKALAKIDQMNADDHPDQATSALLRLHEILSMRNNHSAGLLGLTVELLSAQRVFDHTLKLIETRQIHPSPDQLTKFSMLASKNNWLDSWPNAILFGRGMAAAMMDDAAKPSHLSWWEVHRRFRYSETIYKAILEGWRAVEIMSDLPPSGQITLVDITNAQRKAGAYASAPALSRPNPFLKGEWQLIEIQLIGSNSWANGLGRVILQVDSYRALLAAHQIKLTTGSFPKTLEEIPTELLSKESTTRLSEAKAILNVTEGKPLTVTFLMPDLTPVTYPREE